MHCRPGLQISPSGTHPRFKYEYWAVANELWRVEHSVYVQSQHEEANRDYTVMERHAVHIPDLFPNVSDEILGK
jgi:hypothetical protein